VTETQYLEDVLPLEKLPQAQETQPRGWHSAAAKFVRLEHQQARSAKCDQSVHLGHKLLQNNLSKPAVGSEKYSRRSCTPQQQQQQQQQQTHKKKQEEEATATKQENAREKRQRNLKKKDEDEDEDEGVIAMPQSVRNGHFANLPPSGHSEPSTHQVHHEGWMRNGLETVFCYVSVP
jgi:hypothetical protein